MISSCSAYRIEKEGVVIGPINTDPQWRGRGIAPDALRMAMNALLERGLGIFYIDTSHTHAASRRAIANFQRIISLPLYPKLTEADVQRVVETVRTLVKTHRR
jgi:ribosomal protein S18 acetylase RimI-like enzyme